MEDRPPCAGGRPRLRHWQSPWPGLDAYARRYLAVSRPGGGRQATADHPDSDGAQPRQQRGRPLDYPRPPPQCRMLTPIFHPNIAPHAICIGDHWSAGEPLCSIVARIGELIAYQSYNTKSPLNGEAARWTTENVDRLPLDEVC